MIPRLKEQYDKRIIIDLQKKFSMKNKLMVPRITKVVLNMGLGADANDKKIVQNSIEDISLISGKSQL
jgi:large subunit ribosomal protein L5